MFAVSDHLCRECRAPTYSDLRNTHYATLTITHRGRYEREHGRNRAGLGGRLGRLARGGTALREPWGYTIDVGTAEHVTRHVLDAVNDGVEERTVRKVADSVTGTGVRLKVFDGPATVAAWLGEGWWTDPEPGYLMSVSLAAAETPPAPDGYRVRVWTRGGVTRVMLAAPDGSWAARGQIVPTGGTAVVDQVETSPHTAAGASAPS